MLFNSHKELTFSDIKAAMKFDDDTCAKNLKSLMLKNYKILSRKNDTGSNVLNPTDVFIINESFSSNLKRVIMPTPVIEEAYKKGKLLILSLTIYCRNCARG
jgi:hypothetical protein